MGLGFRVWVQVQDMGSRFRVYDMASASCLCSRGS